MKKRSFILVVFLLVCSLFCLTACQGEQGPAGDKGPTGDKGAAGDKGATGPAGQDAGNYEFKVEGNGIYYAYETEEGEKEWKPVISFDDLFGYKRTYTITLDADGGTLTEGTEVSGCVYKEDAFLEEPTKDGFTFLGWFDEDGNKVEDNILNVTRDYTLKAQWEAVEAEEGAEGEGTGEGETA